MADPDKKHDATPQRIRKAREEGNVFQSQEVKSVGLLIVGAGALFSGMGFAFAQMQGLLERIYLSAASTELTTKSVPGLFASIGLEIASFILPFLGLLTIGSVAFSIGQSGWNVSMKPLTPSPDKINPFKGIKRLFNVKGLFQLLKALIKIAIVGPIAYLNIKSHLDEILRLHTMPMMDALETTTMWILLLIGQMLVALLVLAVADFAFEKWKYNKDLKMTDQEVKDEAKETQGDPHMKGRRRELARQLRDRPRMDHAVMASDVVVTNPTHYAIGLQYDPDVGGAPRVLIKGIRERALRIKKMAHEMDVPTVEDRPLAHALYDNIEEGDEISEDLYPAVAALLAEIYRQRGYGPGETQR